MPYSYKNLDTINEKAASWYWSSALRSHNSYIFVLSRAFNSISKITFEILWIVNNDNDTSVSASSRVLIKFDISVMHVFCI